MHLVHDNLVMPCTSCMGPQQDSYRLAVVAGEEQSGNVGWHKRRALR